MWTTNPTVKCEEIIFSFAQSARSACTCRNTHATAVMYITAKLWQAHLCLSKVVCTFECRYTAIYTVLWEAVNN